MAWARYTHARVNPRSPEAFGVCDRCQFVYQHNRLTWQFDWQGPRLQNKRILVCQTCLDVPQQQLRTIIIPADPIPIQNARQDPNMFMGQSSANSAINNSSEQVTPTPAYIAAGYEGYPPMPALTFDSATASGVTFFNNNLTVINYALTSGSQSQILADPNNPVLADPGSPLLADTQTNAGAKVSAIKISGLWYIEFTLSALNIPGGSYLRCGVDIDSDTYIVAASTASNGTFVDYRGTIWALGVNTGYSINNLQQGDIIGVAVSRDANLAWFRKTPGGYWNGSVTADPVANTGGAAVTPLSTGVEPIVTFGGTYGTINNAWTVNTNAQSFTGQMPLGYSAWSATTPADSGILLADDGSPLLADVGSPILVSS